MKLLTVKKLIACIVLCVGVSLSYGMEAEAKGFDTVGVDNVFHTSEETPTSEEGKNDDYSINGFTIEMDEDGNITTSLDETTGDNDSWGVIFNKVKYALAGVSGLLALIFMGFFLKNFAVLGATSNNPSARKDALVACFWTGVGAALCGAITLVTAIFWNFFS